MEYRIREFSISTNSLDSNYIKNIPHQGSVFLIYQASRSSLSYASHCKTWIPKDQQQSKNF